MPNINKVDLEKDSGRRILPNLFHEVRTTLKLKPDRR